eukprot:TRINITY_DN8496_c0_g1_i1.p1 TRINITY_DN8496_c0_g1~~TRINITY_DN8496_c0_g1_i1.p1  ORF type:complete len:304 (+),score=73.35 TRINITY_DN8496_c0_g1_i1:37-912(+)
MAAHPVTTIDPKDTATFSKLGKAWWNRHGEMYPLHHLNPPRVKYIVHKLYQHHAAEARLSAKQLDQAVDHYFTDLHELSKTFDFTAETADGIETYPVSLPAELQVLKGISILDIGCGGGLLSEPLAYLGAQVTGIDSVGEALPVARVHAEAFGLDVEYLQITAEDLAEQQRTFDAVLVMEVIEHVANVPVFLKACRDLVRPGCPMILSTPNRNWLSYLIVIIAAEYILGFIPIGMHSWSQFIQPNELYAMAKPLGLVPLERKGFVLDLFRWRWYILNIDWVDYIVHFVRQD